MFRKVQVFVKNFVVSGWFLFYSVFPWLWQ